MAGLTGMGVSAVAIIAGVIMRYAVAVHTSGFNLHKVGIILIVAGAIGFVISTILFASTRGAVVGTKHTMHSETRDSNGNTVVQDRTER